MAEIAVFSLRFSEFLYFVGAKTNIVHLGSRWSRFVSARTSGARSAAPPSLPCRARPRGTSGNGSPRLPSDTFGRMSHIHLHPCRRIRPAPRACEPRTGTHVAPLLGLTIMPWLAACIEYKTHEALLRHSVFGIDSTTHESPSRVRNAPLNPAKGSQQNKRCRYLASSLDLSGIHPLVSHLQTKTTCPSAPWPRAVE